MESYLTFHPVHAAGCFYFKASIKPINHGKSIKGSLVELTKFRNSLEVFALIDELDLDPARNEKRISRSRKQSYRRNSWHVY